ncbi:MAG: reverse transcriptase domain-containing protein [Bacteroidales bacterium]
MKRIGNLYEKVCSMENLILADNNARKGKSRQYGVILFDKNKTANLELLHQMLINNEFKTSKYHVFKLDSNGKEREICRLPYFPDRIVHHAIMQVVKPIWLSTFTADTYSCIEGRGIHQAVNKLKVTLQNTEDTRYCLKLDIKKYYPSVDHAVLKQIIRKKIKDPDLLLLLDQIIDSAPGLPIGNYLSQYFSNLYLSGLDHYCKEVLRVKHYYRYADDIVVLHSDKSYLHDILRSINGYVFSNLNLTIKGNYQVFPVEARGLDFLGYVFRHTHVLLRKSIKQRFARKMALLRNNPEKRALSYASYKGWSDHCNSKNLIKKLNHEIKFGHSA